MRENRELKRIDEAKWLFYESNFMKSGLFCSNEAHDSLINICFVEDLKIDENKYGDTLELVIHAYFPDTKLECRTMSGVTLNIFGFYPSCDTVAYRSSTTFKFNRSLESDSSFKNAQWMGLYPRAQQKSLFKIFILENYSKVNKWIKYQAEIRGYLDEVVEKSSNIN